MAEREPLVLSPHERDRVTNSMAVGKHVIAELDRLRKQDEELRQLLSATRVEAENFALLGETQRADDSTRFADGLAAILDGES